MALKSNLGDARSAADRLLGLRVRILPGACILSVVSVVCYQVEVSASSEEVLPTVVCLSVSVKSRY